MQYSFAELVAEQFDQIVAQILNPKVRDLLHCEVCHVRSDALKPAKVVESVVLVCEDCHGWYGRQGAAY